jgi:Domain of unknown function (DUF4185)
MQSRSRILCSIVLVLMCHRAVAAEEPLSFRTEPAPEYDALFQQRDGWIGADGAYSTPLSKDKTVWLFSDTWVGKIRDGRRVDATIVNNSVAIQDGVGPNANVRFSVRRDEHKKPVALIVPSDGHGWYWLQAGTRVGDKLYLFLTQIERTSDPGVFGFHQIGQWLGVVDNPDADPLDWHIEQRKLPCTLFQALRQINFGAGLLVDGNDLYIYGTDEDRTKHPMERFLIAARVPMEQIDDFAQWQFYDDGKWTNNFQSSSRLTDGVAAELSVSYVPAVKKYVLVYSEAGLSPNILIRTAPTPTGPWSQPVSVYRCPEAGWDNRIFCYAAKNHPELAGNGELLISYAANSFELSHVVADARLYWPRFIRVKLGTE